jgi:hypothetical protein
MSFLRHPQIYRSDGRTCCRDEAERFNRIPEPFIVSMSLRQVIPWRVGLHQSPPPLHLPVSIFGQLAETVNHHSLGAGEFSSGTMGSFKSVLTRERNDNGHDF